VRAFAPSEFFSASYCLQFKVISSASAFCAQNGLHLWSVGINYQIVAFGQVVDLLSSGEARQATLPKL
jgi:hypothetical protein